MWLFALPSIEASAGQRHGLLEDVQAEVSGLRADLTALLHRPHAGRLERQTESRTGVLQQKIDELQLEMQDAEQEVAAESLVNQFDADGDGMLDARDVKRAIAHHAFAVDEERRMSEADADNWCKSSFTCQADKEHTYGTCEDPTCAPAKTAGNAVYDAGDVKVVMSFGTRGGPNDKDMRLGFVRAKDFVTAMTNELPVAAAAAGDSFTYIDAIVLPTKPGAVCPRDKTTNMPWMLPTGPMVLNCWWSLYYQDAMKKADVMVFLLTTEWLMQTASVSPEVAGVPRAMFDKDKDMSYNPNTVTDEQEWVHEHRAGKTNVFVICDTEIRDAVLEAHGGDRSKIMCGGKPYADPGRGEGMVGPCVSELATLVGSHATLIKDWFSLGPVYFADPMNEIHTDYSAEIMDQVTVIAHMVRTTYMTSYTEAQVDTHYNQAVQNIKGRLTAGGLSPAARAAAAARALKEE